MSNFIFIHDVLKVIEAGRQVIEIPPRGRISPAAMDLIRERGLKIKSAGQPDETQASPADQVVQPRQSHDSSREAQSSTPSPVRPAPDLSDAEIQVIVQRVLDAVRQAKVDSKPAATSPAQGQAEEDDLVICRCEEITRGEIKAAISHGLSTLNGVKRVTRAGMGLCQGQTCQRLVTQILAGELGLSLAEVEPITSRAPVRPVRLSVLATG